MEEGTKSWMKGRSTMRYSMSRFYMMIVKRILKTWQMRPSIIIVSRITYTSSGTKMFHSVRDLRLQAICTSSQDRSRIPMMPWNSRKAVRDQALQDMVNNEPHHKWSS